MKIAMMGSDYCLDTDICIIHGLQKRGMKIAYFFCMRDLANPLFKLKDYYPSGIIPAKDIKEMQIYKDYINFDDLYMISAPGYRFRNSKFFLLYFKAMLRIIRFSPVQIHHTWPWTGTPAITYFLPYKKTMFVHDPLPHSSDTNNVYEKYRRLGYKIADKLILLNNKTTNEFCERYNVPLDKIAFSQLCIFDYLRYIPSVKVEIKEKYLLFLVK